MSQNALSSLSEEIAKGEKAERHTLIGNYIFLTTMSLTLKNIITLSSFFKQFSKSIVNSGISVAKIMKDDIFKAKDLLINAIKTANQEAMELVYQSTEYKNSVMACYTLKSLIECLVNMMKRSSDLKLNSLVRDILDNSDSPLGLLIELVPLLAMSVSPDECMFYTDVYKSQLGLAEKAKNECLEMIVGSLKTIIHYAYIKAPSKKEAVEYSQYLKIKTLAPLIISSVYNLFGLAAKDLQLLLTENESLRDCLHSSLEFIAKTSSLINYYDVYSTNFRELFSRVFLRCLGRTDSEIESFHDNEIEFLNYSHDVCLLHKSKTIKSIAMNCVVNICEKIDGAMTFVAMGMMALVDTVLSGMKEEEVLQMYPNLEPFLKGKFVKENISNPEDVLDSCILVICALQEVMVEREDLL